MQRKGHRDDWIEKRLRGIVIRDESTDQWKKNVNKQREYEILTAEISKATFGMTPSIYKKYRNNGANTDFPLINQALEKFYEIYYEKIDLL